MAVYISIFGTAKSRMLSIDGPNISVPKLKENVFKMCSCLIGSRSWNKSPFDVDIVNPDTNKTYPDDHLISAYSSVLARRVPLDREEAAKIRRESLGEPARQPAPGNTSNGSRNTNGQAPLPDPVARPTTKFVDLTTMEASEEDRIAIMMHLSTEQFGPKYYVTPNPYPAHNGATVSRCNHCRNEGHWHRNCPLKKINRANGIPAHRLQVVDDPTLPGVLFNGDGKYVIVKKENDSSVPAPRTAATASDPRTAFSAPRTAALAPSTAVLAPTLRRAAPNSVPQTVSPTLSPPTAAHAPVGLSSRQCIHSHPSNKISSSRATPDSSSSQSSSSSSESEKWIAETQSISVIGSTRGDQKRRHSPLKARMTFSSSGSSSPSEETDLENQRRRNDACTSDRHIRDHPTTRSRYGQSPYPEKEFRCRPTHRRDSPLRRDRSSSRTRSGSSRYQDSSRIRYESSRHQVAAWN